MRFPAWVLPKAQEFSDFQRFKQRRAHENVRLALQRPGF
jgi:hypothetical protein